MHACNPSRGIHGDGDTVPREGQGGKGSFVVGILGD